ncbi:hypothetical protein NDI56_10300 [Haloarcula sp. S1CR25-12]|uniref:Nucleotide-diphospho-sugar transferase n=1 Tax=Haloarcula saliterrae TaxID=2950534 RepID=A0ABU2FC28_9EURY|nr:hypothetical protein [Haloarcula sp. S1CR25-12]MDS0259781.1 hypothetical protein [Haloarcula sp. S1CR25-12]
MSDLVSNPNKNATISFAAGSGKFEKMAVYLAKSINNNTSYRSVVFIPESEIDDISDNSLSLFDELCTDVVQGETTIPDYGQSAKLDAFAIAADRYAPPHILVDTDVLVFDSPSIQFTEADVFAKPVDIGAQYWGSQAAISEWREIYSSHGFEFPNTRTQSTVDGRQILPYYNAGVVATSRSDIPQQWLELTDSVFSQITQPFYADQVSLAMIMSKFEHEELTERENYPASVRTLFPSDISILHYHHWDTLYRAKFSRYHTTLNDIGVTNGLAKSGTEQLRCYTKSLKRVFDYRAKKQVKRKIINDLPPDIVEKLRRWKP